MNMNTEYIVAVIGIVGAVIVYVFTSWYKEKKETISAFQSVINEIQCINVVNNYPVALNKLRLLFVEHSHTINNKELISFYNNWLTDPLIENAQPVSNLYTNEKQQKMLGALSKIKL